jgi:putative methanogenesis marker protein 8
MDEHVIEAMGKTRIVIKDGKVVEVGEPKIKYCPLFHKYRGIEELDSKSIKENIEFRIDDFGMCTPQRELKMKDFLSFGISEIISTLLDEKVIDCAIMACEGAGTILVYEGEIAQGVGGRISGMVSTTPIPEIIETLGEQNVLDPETASINQVQGVRKAIDRGYKNIAVTLVSPSDAAKIREIEKNNEEVNIYIFAVHVTGLNPYEAHELFQYSDVITACASHTIREIGEKSALLKVGASIPIYAATKAGKEFLLMRIEKIGGIKDKKDARLPEPLI